MMAGPRLSPVSLLCKTCAPSHTGNLALFQQRQTTHVSPTLRFILLTTFSVVRSILVFTRSPRAVIELLEGALLPKREGSRSLLKADTTVARQQSTSSWQMIVDSMVVLVWGWCWCACAR